MNFETVIPYEPGHHSISQHSATGETAGISNIETDCEDTFPDRDESIDCTVNYDGLIVQRWALVAHEIAHNLGAQHSNDPDSFMHGVLTNNMKYEFTGQTKSQIDRCLASEEIIVGGSMKAGTCMP